MNFTFALEQFELFVLILIRLASFVFAAPFFNMANVPRKVKAGFALCLTVLVYSLFPDMTVEYNGMIDYAIIVVEEMIVGILLGAVTSFCVQIIMFAGKIIDMDIGISMAQLYDPTTRMQVGIMGNFYYYMMMLLLIISGMHQYLVAAIVETYKVIPIGGVKFRCRNIYCHNKFYVRFFCYRIQNCTSGIFGDSYVKLCACDSCQGITSDEYVCCWYAA